MAQYMGTIMSGGSIVSSSKQPVLPQPIIIRLAHKRA